MRKGKDRGDKCWLGWLDWMGYPHKSSMVCGVAGERRGSLGLGAGQKVQTRNDQWLLYGPIDVNLANLCALQNLLGLL